MRFCQKYRIFLHEHFFSGCVMVASLLSMLFQCVSLWQGGASLWLMICHNNTQKTFSHFILVLESELSNMLETCTWVAWLLNLSIKKKKNQPKPIIRTGVTVPNVRKCVMVAILTLHVRENMQCTQPQQKSQNFFKLDKFIFGSIFDYRNLCRR